MTFFDYILLKSPLCIIMLLSKKRLERHVCNVWDHKSDDQILAALEDATEWIECSEGSLGSETLDRIASRAKDRLNMRILPQIIRRGLTT